MSRQRNAPTVSIDGWVTTPALLAGTCLQCIDGRIEEGRIGAPGGDFGELRREREAVELVGEFGRRSGEVAECFEPIPRGGVDLRRVAGCFGRAGEEILERAAQSRDPFRLA